MLKKLAVTAVAVCLMAVGLTVGGCDDDKPVINTNGGGNNNGGGNTNGGGNNNVGVDNAVQYPVKSIYVSHGAMQFNIGEFKIDFQNKEFWHFPGGLDTRRDAAAENEGFDFAGSLSAEKISVFFEQIETRGFNSWVELYECPSLVDGHCWNIRITYSDDSKKMIVGCNHYPDTWPDVFDAFMDLTGKAVLDKREPYRVCPNPEP